MNLLLRAIGVYWIWATFQPVYILIRRFPDTGLHWVYADLFNLAMLIGGVGLLLLREWGRWIILIGTGVHLILTVGPQIIQLNLTAWVVKSLFLYGLMMIVLILPHARSATR